MTLFSRGHFIKLSYVRSEEGNYYIMCPVPLSRYGFELWDGTKAWDGGVGVADAWENLWANEVPRRVKLKLGKLKEYRSQS